MKEIWKDIVGYEGYYQVSNQGNVYSNRMKANLKPKEDRYGYLCVNLSLGGKRQQKKIHRVVYESFIGELDRTLVIDHIDEDKQNNCPSNLRQVLTRTNTSRGHTNKTGSTGVRFFSHIDKFGAEIQIEGNDYFLGVFNSKEEAKNAYDNALMIWNSKKEKPATIKKGYKECRICKSEKKESDFRKTKTKKGANSTYYACVECEKKLKSERYYRNKQTK